jgi:hypothetical protein
MLSAHGVEGDAAARTAPSLSTWLANLGVAEVEGEVRRQGFDSVAQLMDATIRARR